MKNEEINIGDVVYVEDHSDINNIQKIRDSNLEKVC